VNLGRPVRAVHAPLRSGSFFRFAGLAAALLSFAPSVAWAQRVVSQVERVISVSRGSSALLINPVPLSRFSVGDPNVAEATVLSPTEVLINGKSLGTTTLLIWDNSGQVRVNSVEVTADAPGLQRFLKQLMPDEDIQVSASGNAVTISGSVKDPNSVARAVDVAKASGATIIDNLVAPQAVQVLVRVRFAEINRTALRDWATRFSTLNPH
jgi:Flp pilus assembly secretin CpaC